MNATTHAAPRRSPDILAIAVGVLIVLAAGLIGCGMGLFFGDLYGATYGTAWKQAGPVPFEKSAEIGGIIGLACGLLISGFVVTRSLIRRARSRRPGGMTA